MSQHDLTIDNQGFPAFRADLNNALQALGSTQSGTTAPSPAFANQLWYDTTNNILKIRNEDNDAWISVVTLDQSADVTSGVGAKTLPTGDLVGTSDSQTLTNKTINASQLVDASVTPAKLSTNAQYTGFKNRIINGAMVIDQRNAGASIAFGDVFPVDRWNCFENGSMAFTGQRSTTAPVGFTNSLLITTTTAASPAAASRSQLLQVIEGYNIADLGWGTANAKTITISFWVRSSLTGQFGGSLQNYATTRSYPFSYTISSANTFEYKTITIAGDTTGTWNTENSGGINLTFDLGMGSDLLGTAGAWAGVNYRGAIGDVKLSETNGATFYITGVQLEVGSTATSFDYRPYGTELTLCQRYFEKTSGAIQGSLSSANGQGNVQWYYKATKRSAPTVTGNNATTDVAVNTVDFAQGTTNNTGGYFATFASGSTASAEL